MEEVNYISIVHSIFVNFFNEENVDLQDNNIIVHFPKVTVTNEDDKSIDITELWVRVPLCENGTIMSNFEMLRSEYTLDQFLSGYSHSHIPTVHTGNFNKWQYPCLGSGPIRGTIAELNTTFSEDKWNLFCYELSKYVETESLVGGPYIRMERVGKPNDSLVIFPIVMSLKTPTLYGKEIINSFIKHIISKRPFNFNYALSYNIAASNYDTTIILSNLFIEWYNSMDSSKRPNLNYLFECSIIKKVKMVGDKLYDSYGSSEYSLPSTETVLLTFKGKEVKFNIIIPDVSINTNEFIILDTKVVEVIIKKMLQIINYKYGREYLFTDRKTLGFI